MPTYVERECVHGHPIGKWNTYCKRGHTSNKDATKPEKPKENIVRRMQDVIDPDIILRLASDNNQGRIYISVSRLGVTQGVVVVSIYDLVRAVLDIKKEEKK